MYNLKIIRSGRRVEIYKINNYLIKQGENHEGTKIIEGIIKGDKPKNKNESQNKKVRKETLNKARNNIIRLIKANEDMNIFITLTFAKEQDYKESKKSLNILFTKLRKDYKGLKYIWVLEYGELKNRLHYHLLCNIPIEIKLSISKEKKSQEHKDLENAFCKKYWKYGFVDIRHLDHEGNSNVALYVATYITKSMENKELEGFRIYGYSNKTLNKPIEEKIYTRDSIEEILSLFKGYSIKFTNSYSIGYIDEKREHIGTVNYYDMELKESK